MAYNKLIISTHLIDAEKIIVGSHTGILRIFSINAGTNEDGNLVGFQASDLLLETDLKMPILQVCAGFLLSATSNIQLAVLQPRKLSVYSISGNIILYATLSGSRLMAKWIKIATAGVTEHGSSYNILLIYEHNLHRNAYNLVIGPFGQVKGIKILA